MRKKKYTIKKIGGIRTAVPCEKDHDRPACAPPVITHKSKKDYNRRQAKLDIRKLPPDVF